MLRAKVQVRLISYFLTSPKGIDINNPAFMNWWERSSHLRNARSFNQDWEAWINIYGANASYADVLNAAAQISAKYGIPFWY